jgi:hypothetical protein
MAAHMAGADRGRFLRSLLGLRGAGRPVPAHRESRARRRGKWAVPAGLLLVLVLVAAPFTATPAGAGSPSPAAFTWTEQTPPVSPPALDNASMAYDPATGQMLLFGGLGVGDSFSAETWLWNGTTWSELSPATSPPGRSQAMMAFDPATGDMVLFGGFNAASLQLNDTWTWNGTTWAELSPATSPGGRFGATMAYDPATGNMVLFGGQNAAQFLDDTWTWNGTTWTELSPATSPSVRFGASMAYDPGTGNLLLFGGDANGDYVNDTWTWNGTTWTELSPAPSPPARFEGTMAYDPGSGAMVLFGGQSNTGYLDDTWNWNGTTWAAQSPATSPGVRFGSAMAYDPAAGDMVLFGGQANTGGYLDETWVLGPPAGPVVDWGQLSPPTSPPARTQSAMAYDASTGDIVLFGGANASGNPLGDTWTWNGTTWAEQRPTASPTARSDASMAYDPATGNMVLFGGDGADGLLSDTWTWNGTTWTQQFPDTSPAARTSAAMAFDPATADLVLFGGHDDSGFLADTWTWNGTVWSKQTPATSPTARSDVGMAYDPATADVVLFGGDTGGASAADTWTWNGATWAKQSPATSPPARLDEMMAYDPGTGNMVLFGGTGATTLGDTWTWNGSTWTEQSLPVSPSARYGATMAYDPGTGNMLLFAGEAATGTVLDDTWAYGTFVAAPGPPTALGATGGNASVSLSWTAPASDGGSAITGYDVYVGTTPGGEAATPVNGTLIAGTTYDVTGLTNGTTYYFTVEAVNAAGNSTASNEASATPATVPGAPTALGATRGNSEVSLSWTAPASNGGSAITGYDVYEGTTPGDESGTPFNASLIAGTTYDVTALTNGTTYYFTVEAVNAVGNSVASNEASATPATVPGPPTALGATSGNAQVSLSWTAPASTGGSAVTGYDVYEGAAPGGESGTPVNASLIAGTTYDVTGLTNGTTYYFTVEAVNAVGNSAASDEASATPATVPGAPTNLGATRGNAQVLLSWTAPTSNGGSAVTGYDIYEGTTPGGESATAVNSSPVTGTTYDVTGLTNGTTYYFTVEAVNAVGNSAASDEASATPATTPGAPTGLSATRGSAKVSLSWTAPTSNGGSAVTGYDIYEGTTQGGESGTPVNSSLVTGTTYVVTGLINGTTYYFTVEAVNAVGNSTASNEASATPGATPSGPPGTGGIPPASPDWALVAGIGLVLAGVVLGLEERRRRRRAG